MLVTGDCATFLQLDQQNGELLSKTVSLEDLFCVECLRYWIFLLNEHGICSNSFNTFNFL